jgi:predicted DNA-binding transcriptional regulator AlpA
MKSEKDERLLTRDQVEDRFGIPKRFLEISAMTGDGPSIVRIGRSVRYRPVDVIAWIAKQTTEMAQ